MIWKNLVESWDLSATTAMKIEYFLVDRGSPNQRFIAMTEKGKNLCAKYKATQAMTDIFNLLQV